MEHYPTELTSPPVPLVALIGQPHLHQAIGDYLRTQALPRLHAIGIADPHSAGGTFGAKKQHVTAGPPPGILKAGWLAKHRATRPAVAAVLVERASVTGDPSAWAWLVQQLDAVRSAAKGRGMRLVVLVVVPSGSGAGSEVPEDRAAMIARQAGIDRRCVLTYAPSEGLPALQVLGRVLHEQAALFYTADAQRRLAVHASRNIPAPELNLRIAFKLGSLAEFRADWGAALKMYREAASYLPQVLSGPALPLQRFVEARAVAEYVHVKIVSLLLLALKQLPEACAQFDAHIRTFRRPPFEPPPGLLGSHHGWLARQFVVMAELLLSPGLDLGGLRQEHQPAQLYLTAASEAIERRKVAAFIRGMLGAGGPATAPSGVGPGLYVGQLAAGDPPRRLREEEFVSQLEAEELAHPHPKATLDLLLTARDAIKRSGARAGRTLHHVTLLLGQEHLQGGQPAPAQRLLTEVAAYYRRQGWQAQLASALLLLRDCAHQLGQPGAHAAASLEAAALDGGTLESAQRAAIASAALMTLLGAAEGTPGGSSGDAQRGEGLSFLVDSPDSGWLNVLPLSAGFLQRASASASAAHGGSSPGGVGAAHGGSSPGAGGASQQQQQQLVFVAGLWNNLPTDLPLLAAELSLRDAQGGFSVPLEAWHPRHGSTHWQHLQSAASASSSILAAEEGVESPAAFKAPRGGWLRLAAEVPARCSGPLQAVALTLHLGPACSLGYALGPALAPARGEVAVGLLRGGYESGVPPFSAASGFVPGRYSTEVPPRHQPPLLRLAAPTVALQGETMVATVTVTAAAEAVAGARLAVRALHRDSQQLLAVAPAPGHPHLAHVPAGAGGGAPAGTEGWQLPELAPGQSLSVRLSLLVPRRGTVDLRAALQYTTVPRQAGTGSSQGSGGAAAVDAAAAAGSVRPEAGKAVAGLVIPVEKPLKLEVQLVGPPNTHALLAPAPPPSTAHNDGDAAATLAAATAGPSLGAAISPRGDPPGSPASKSAAASPTKAAAAAAHGPGAMAGSDSADIAALLARDLPSRLALLPAGQDCTAVVVLTSTASTPVEVVGVELQPSAAAAAAGLHVAAAAVGAPKADSPATLALGDALTVLLPLSAPTPAELSSLGVLAVAWRRHGVPTMQARAVRGAVVMEGSEHGIEGAPEQLQQAAALTTTAVPLPAVSFRPRLLTARASWSAAGVEMGQPLALALHLENGSSATGLDVTVSVGEPRGFLLAGPKADALYLLPGTSSEVRWQAVPYHAGRLALPQIHVTAPGLGLAADVTGSASLVVTHRTGSAEAHTDVQQNRAAHTASGSDHSVVPLPKVAAEVQPGIV